MTPEFAAPGVWRVLDDSFGLGGGPIGMWASCSTRNSGNPRFVSP